MLSGIETIADISERQRILTDFLAAIQSPSFRELRVSILFSSGASIEAFAKPFADLTEQDVCLAHFRDVAICQEGIHHSPLEKQTARTTQVDLNYQAAAFAMFIMNLMEDVAAQEVNRVVVCVTSSARSLEIIFDRWRDEDIFRDCLYTAGVWDLLSAEKDM